MKKMIKFVQLNRASLLIVVLLLSSIGIGAAWAASNRLKTETVKNDFYMSEVSVQLIESFDGSKKTNVHVQNTGSTSNPVAPAVYVRVRLLAYWYQPDSDHIASKSAWEPSFTPGSKWLKIGDYYYYQEPVIANGKTTDLISSIELKEDAEHYRQVLEIVVEAIQSVPAEAVTSSWGVRLDGNGYIVN